MNPAPLHLVLNHLPVVLTAFTILLLVMAPLKKSEKLKRVGIGLLAGNDAFVIRLPSHVGSACQVAARQPEVGNELTNQNLTL